jgi:hypothetical protein
MKRIKKIIFFGLSLLFSMQHLFSRTPFESMPKEMTQGLLHAVQYTPFEGKDSHFQQLLHSTLSQLQNTDRVSDIDVMIGIIISNLEKRKQDSEEIGLSFTIITISHVLRIAAQRLYAITSCIRNNLYYWQQVDQQSVVSYCLTHFPTLWGAKIGNHLDIKEKILTAEKLHTVFITHLGTIFRLIHTLPTKIDTHLSKKWIDASFAAISDLCGDKSIAHTVQDNTNEKAAILSLNAIKDMLVVFEACSKKNVLAVTKAISQPTFVKRDFGKIIATIGTVAGVGAFAYYKARSIQSWGKTIFDHGKNQIWDPIFGFIKENILVSEPTINSITNQNIPEKFQDYLNRLKIAESSEQPEQFMIDNTTDLLRLANHDLSENKISEEEIQELAAIIIKNNQHEVIHNLIMQYSINVDNFAGTAKNIFLSKEGAKNGNEIFNSLFTSLKKGLPIEIALMKREGYAPAERIRKIVVLTLAVLSIFALYKGGATVYNYVTKKDYHILQKSLKELETATICSIDQPDDNQNYGMFIFILESLKQGVVQTVSSRYTDKQELLCDLARLESPELTFEQRYKLIAQIKREYGIFQKQ